MQGVSILACTCINYGNFNDQAKYANLIVEAKVIKIDYIVTDSDPIEGEWGINKITLLLNHTYKSDSIINSTQDTLYIYTESNLNGCSYRFILGETYLIFSDYKEMKTTLELKEYVPYTNKCYMNKNVADLSWNEKRKLRKLKNKNKARKP